MIKRLKEKATRKNIIFLLTAVVVLLGSSIFIIYAQTSSNDCSKSLTSCLTSTLLRVTGDAQIARNLTVNAGDNSKGPGRLVVMSGGAESVEKFSVDADGVINLCADGNCLPIKILKDYGNFGKDVYGEWKKDDFGKEVNKLGYGGCAGNDKDLRENGACSGANNFGEIYTCGPQEKKTCWDCFYAVEQTSSFSVVAATMTRLITCEKELKYSIDVSAEHIKIE